MREIEARRDRDRVLGPDAAALHPVLALHVEDEAAGPDLRDAGSDRRDPADTFGAGGRRQRRPQAVAAAAKRDVGRVDRESEHVEDDFTWTGRAEGPSVFLESALVQLGGKLALGELGQLLQVDDADLRCLHCLLELFEEFVDRLQFLLDLERLRHGHRGAAGELVLRRQFVDLVLLAEPLDEL